MTAVFPVQIWIVLFDVVHGAGEGTLPVHRFDSYGALKSIPVVIEGSNKTDSRFKSAATL